MRTFRRPFRLTASLLALGLASVALAARSGQPGPPPGVTERPPANTAPSRNSEGPRANFGLSDDQQRAVFQTVIAAESLADQEAAVLYSPSSSSPAAVSSFTQERNRRIALYHDQVARQYGLTAAQLKVILARAYEQRWPISAPYVY